MVQKLRTATVCQEKYKGTLSSRKGAFVSLTADGLSRMSFACVNVHVFLFGYNEMMNSHATGTLLSLGTQRESLFNCMQ